MQENEIRKLIWERSAAVDEKIAEEGFLELPTVEQEAWVISLQVGVDFALVLRCLDGSASETEIADVRARVAEAFEFGKRKALRHLRAAIASYPSLRK